MKKIVLFVFLSVFFFSAFAADREFYEIRVYYLENKAQEQKVDNYLQNALLPALHRAGLDRIGVFKPLGNDTSSTRRIVLLIPFKKLKQFTELPSKLKKDKDYQSKATDYLEAAWNQPAYKRMETILLQAFTRMPVAKKPNLKSPKSDRIYELRSYEGASEKLYASKVHMFNEGGEIALFNRLNFNAIFYGEVLAGCHMPNLMYMTSFENKEVRDQYWKNFSADPEWKVLSAKPEYQHTVSRNDTQLMRATEYSDL